VQEQEGLFRRSLREEGQDRDALPRVLSKRCGVPGFKIRAVRAGVPEPANRGRGGLPMSEACLFEASDLGRWGVSKRQCPQNSSGLEQSLLE
jgi:hypothetical protein